MIKIAFCDDEIEIINQLKPFITQYCEETKHCITYDAYTDSDQFLNEVKNGTVYDAVFLDIFMPKKSGMDIALTLRNNHYDKKIIFLTSSPDYGVESYSVDAFYYQLKPIEKNGFYKLLDKLCSTIVDENTHQICVKHSNGISNINTSSIMYCEVIMRKMYYHLSNGLVLVTGEKMGELELIFDQYQEFSKPHRSYIVNMKYIRTVRTNEIELIDNTVLPLSKANYNNLCNYYMNFYFKEGGL